MRWFDSVNTRPAKSLIHAENLYHVTSGKQPFDDVPFFGVLGERFQIGIAQAGFNTRLKRVAGILGK